MGALPILYSFRRCPYAMRARLALSVSGQAHELREIVLRNKPADLLTSSPKGTVPVLVLPNGQVIEQSLDIMRWALQHHDPQGWLSADCAATDKLIAANDGPFKHSLDRYKYPNRHADESGSDAAGFALKHRTEAAQWLAQLDARLDGGWLLGARASLADMALLPFVRQLAHTDTGWFAVQPWPRLLAWLAAFEASDLYAGVMQKHAPWQPAAVA